MEISVTNQKHKLRSAGVTLRFDLWTEENLLRPAGAPAAAFKPSISFPSQTPKRDFYHLISAGRSVVVEGLSGHTLTPVT